MVIVLVACGGPLLANPPVDRAEPRSPAPAASPPADPTALVFPRYEAAHDRLTEWWYYTGHLRAGDGRRFGFEFVVFRAERGSFPVSWASHLALTDEGGQRFRYEQRSEIGLQVDLRPPAGFDLAVRRQPLTAYNDFALVAQSPSDYYELYLYNAISKTDAAEISFGDESMAAVKVMLGTRRDGANLALPSWRLRVAA